MTAVGLTALLLALGFLAAAKVRSLQPEDEQAPFRRSVVYAILGVGFGVLALALLPQAGHA